MATNSAITGSLMATPLEPVAEHGVGNHQGKAAEANGQKD
jgi:hypothetical protein